MALSISELNTVSKKYFDPMIEPQVYEASPFFKKLKKDHKVTTGGGTKIQFPIRYQKLGQGEVTGPRAQVEFQSKTTRTGGETEWTYYHNHTMMHLDEKIKNAGPGQIVDLMKDKAKELIEDIQDVLNDALYATSRTEGYDMDSLPIIVDSAADYAGIAVSDASEWASIEDDSTTTLKIYGSGSLSYMINQATFGTKGPTMHVTTRDLWSKYESLLQPQVRYEDKEMANLGFRSLQLYGKPVVSDYDCPDGYWFGLDMDAFELRTHKDESMKPTDWFDLKQAGFPNAVAKYVIWVGNLMCRRRKTSFKFSALDDEL